MPAVLFQPSMRPKPVRISILAVLVLLFLALAALQSSASATQVQQQNRHHRHRSTTTTSSATSTTSTTMSTTSTTTVPKIQVAATLATGTEPKFAAYDPANGDMYVSNVGSDTVSVISPDNQVVSTISISPHPGYLLYDPANGDMYVAYGGFRAQALAEIDSTTNEVIGTLAFSQSCSGSYFNYMIYATSNGEIYVWGSSYCLIVVDPTTNTVSTTLSIGVGGERVLQPIAYDPATQDVYVTTLLYVGGHDVPTLAIIGTLNNQIATEITTHSNLDYLYYNPSGGYVLGTEDPSDLFAINAEAKVAFAAGPFPYGAYDSVYSPADGVYYVGGEDLSTGSAVLSEVSPTGSYEGAFSGGGTGPAFYFVYNPSNGLVYAFNIGEAPTYAGTVSIISAGRATQTLSVGSFPVWGAYDPANGSVLVLNMDSNTVSVLTG